MDNSNTLTYSQMVRFYEPPRELLPHSTQSSPHTMYHKEKICMLRDQWLNRDSIPTCLGTGTLSAPDSGLDVSPMDEPLEEDSLNMTDTSRSLARDPSHMAGYDESLLIDSLRMEAESTQQMVDMMSCTKTMRRRKELYNDLTYRRRGRQARQSLNSYSPQAPVHHNWGNIFDEMLAKLRGVADDYHEITGDGRTPSVCMDCKQRVGNSLDNVSLYDNNTSGSESCIHSLRGQYESISHSCPDFDNFADILEGEEPDGRYFARSSSTYSIISAHSESADHVYFPSHCSDSELAALDGKILAEAVFEKEYAYVKHAVTSFTNNCDERSESNTAEFSARAFAGPDYVSFWEDNWSDHEVLNDLDQPYCEGCLESMCEDDPKLRPKFCYKNYNCANGSSMSNKSSPNAEEIALLRSLSWRCPELASFTIPLSPIRKTESNSHVWIQRDSKPDETVTVIKHPSSSKPFTALWKRIKRLFGSS